jgi:hypothetical protein
LNAQNTENIISKYVGRKIAINLVKIPVGKEASFGFESRDNFNKCIVGKSLRVITIDKNDSLVELNEWRVPIKLDGINKILFTVIESEGSFKIVDIGGHKLAKELQNFESNQNISQYLLRLYNLHCDFITDYRSGIVNIRQANYIPLESAKVFLEKFSTENQLKPSFTIEQIIELNKLNME